MAAGTWIEGGQTDGGEDVGMVGGVCGGGEDGVRGISDGGEENRR